MSLHDHFRGRLATHRHWTSFHADWATYLAEDLNDRLMPGYFAEPIAQFQIEIDVATWEEQGARSDTTPGETWEPSAPLMTVPFVLATDIVEVLIYRSEGGPVLAGAIEFVSPANKDRPANRDAFVSKCASYLQQGVGLALVDIVTDRKANLHHLLLERTVPSLSAGQVQQDDLYASAYRPVQKNAQTTMNIWYEPLRLGGQFPTLPLWLRGGARVPIRLEETYEKTIQKLRILANGE